MTAIRTIKAVLDINKRTWEIERIEAVQGDVKSLTVEASVIQRGVGLNITGWRSSFLAVLNDSYIVSDPMVDIVDAKNGRFNYTFCEAAFSIPGEIEASFVLIKEDGTELTGMPRFTYHVAPNKTEGKLPIENYIGEFAKLQAQITDILLQNNDLQAQIDAMNVVKQSETTNWQKGVKITADSGNSKALPTGVTDWNNFVETGLYTVYATSLTANKPPAPGPYLNVEIHRRSTDTTYQRVTDVASNRTFYRSQLTGTWTSWLEAETITGAQAKADAAKASANNYTNTAIMTFAPYIELFNGAAYFLDTNVFTFPANVMQIGLYIQVSRYTPGTGPLNYGTRTIIIPRESMSPAIGTGWEPMAGTDGAKKVLIYTNTSIKGHADNGTAPNNGWCVRTIGYR